MGTFPVVFYEPDELAGIKKPLKLRSNQGLWYCMNLMNQFLRRRRDSNPRTVRSTVFKTAAIDHSATSPVAKLIEFFYLNEFDLKNLSFITLSDFYIWFKYVSD